MQVSETQIESGLTEEEERVRNITNKVTVKDPVMLAMYLVEEYPDIIRCGHGDQQNIYRFNGKCYDIMTDRELEALFLSFVKKYGITMAWKIKNLVLSAFLGDSDVVIVDKMNDYDNLLCLNNGILNIHTKEFIAHSNKYYFDSFVNVDYNPENKDCPVFKKYLKDTFNNDTDTIDNIVRLGGYLLDTSCAAERMFLFDGSGANGKSVLINTFQLFFSDDQITPLSLEVMASNGFSKELLIRSRVNFCAEQKKAYLDSEELKKIITGDKIEINRKFKLSLSFTPKTKIILACNGLPKFNDTTHAIYRRMILIRFHNQYLNGEEYARVKNPEKTGCFLKDKDMFNKIKQETSAILNLFIEGLIDLRTNNYEFIESSDSIASMMEFKRDSDTVREFLEDNYEVDEGGEGVDLAHVYDHYRGWHRSHVQDSSQMKMRSAEFGKRIKEIMGVTSMGQKYVWNEETQRKERETLYPIKHIVFPDDVEAVMTPEEAKQQGLDFGG
jgi:P4 family phage/plasmid primase-like protien